MISTTIEQSKKLLELGIDPSTSDMYWDSNTLPPIVFPMLFENDVQNDYEYMQENGLIPAWSLLALLKLIPTIDEETYILSGTTDGGCICEHSATSVMFQEKEPIDAVFKMVVWLKEKSLL